MRRKEGSGEDKEIREEVKRKEKRKEEEKREGEKEENETVIVKRRCVCDNSASTEAFDLFSQEEDLERCFFFFGRVTCWRILMTCWTVILGLGWRACGACCD